MAKDAYFFSHDGNARTDPKIMAMLLEYKAEGYGLYWTIIEMLSEHDGYKLKKSKITYNAIAMAMLCDSNAIEKFVNSCVCDYELFESDGIHFWSESLNRRMKFKDEKAAKRSEAGKKGAASRWKNTENDEEEKQNDSNGIANASQSHSNDIAKDSKQNKTKLNETKETKIKYAEYVSMTETEYNKLVSEYGQVVIGNKITDLNLWKGSKGKKTKSDYMTILAWIRKDNISPTNVVPMDRSRYID